MCRYYHDRVTKRRKRYSCRALNNQVHSVFVNGRGRDILMQDMQRRIERDDIEKEKEDIIQVGSLSASVIVPLFPCFRCQPQLLDADESTYAVH